MRYCSCEESALTRPWSGKLGHQQTCRMELSLIHLLEAERGTWVSLPLQITWKDLTEAIWFMLKVKQHFCCFCRRYMHMGLKSGTQVSPPFSSANNIRVGMGNSLPFCSRNLQAVCVENHDLTWFCSINLQHSSTTSFNTDSYSIKIYVGLAPLITFCSLCPFNVVWTLKQVEFLLSYLVLSITSSPRYTGAYSMQEMKKGQNLQAFLEPLQTQGAAQKLQQAQNNSQQLFASTETTKCKILPMRITT